MNYFVTGTDTDVGKTLVSCALLHAFAEQGMRVVGMKPVAAGGCDENGRNDDDRKLRAASSVQAGFGQTNPYCFTHAVAPHLAARFVGVSINMERIIESYRELAAQADVVIVEGAGGFRVPLNDRQEISDIAVELGLPVILVVGMRLGCINHALLTVDAIRAKGLELAGWVANVMDENMEMLEGNMEALKVRIEAPLLGVFPHQAIPDAKDAAKRLDVALLAR